MPATKVLESLCHVTDASGMVHLAHVRRIFTRKLQKIVSVTVTTGCTPSVSRWDATQTKTSPDNLPQGMDLPKILHGGCLLVKYEPEALAAPAITCMLCTTMRWNHP